MKFNEAYNRNMEMLAVNEGFWSELGHFTLDVAGLVPGVGEIADGANVLWYLGKKEYVNAALSAISMIPGLGDIVAKGVKYLGKTPKIAQFIAKHGDEITKAWIKVKVKIKQVDTIKDKIGDEEIANMENALKSFLSGKQQTSPLTPMTPMATTS